MLAAKTPVVAPDRALRRPTAREAHSVKGGEPTAANAAVVRMDMSVDDALALRHHLRGLAGQPRARRLHDQLWLRAVFCEQRRRTARVDRQRFDERADSILTLLDPES